MICPRCFREYRPAHRFCPFDGERLSDRALDDLLRSRPPQETEGVYGNRYAVRGALGRGAMARVFLGEDLFTKEAVAIKVLDRFHAALPGVRERFLREAHATARVAHPHIVKTFEAGEGPDGLPYLVLEVLSGEPLGARLAREPIPPLPLTLMVLCQTASALIAAHEAGVVHRDVKPDNIFLMGNEPEVYGVKLLDFGLAKVAAHPGFTQAGTAVGTVEYMAPEQVVSDPADGRTDVYGLGVVMYRLFTGMLPFATRGVDLLAQQLLVPPEPPGSRGVPLDPAVEQVILSALRKVPENRYASMRHFLDDLERLAGRRPGPVAGTSLPVVPDTYAPGRGYPRSAAAFLHRRIGRAPPVWDE